MRLEKDKPKVKEARDSFLPVNREDMERRGWDSLDFLVVSGDAYVDHPSFGHASSQDGSKGWGSG